jgi:hypothetical protein
VLGSQSHNSGAREDVGKEAGDRDAQGGAGAVHLVAGVALVVLLELPCLGGVQECQHLVPGIHVRLQQTVVCPDAAFLIKCVLAVLAHQCIVLVTFLVYSDFDFLLTDHHYGYFFSLRSHSQKFFLLGGNLSPTRFGEPFMLDAIGFGGKLVPTNLSNQRVLH